MPPLSAVFRGGAGHKNNQKRAASRAFSIYDSCRISAVSAQVPAPQHKPCVTMQL
jgi:hypothetical protein